jgi:diadenosine tetraphosphate (Ap4A) HIT family hydrolase
MAEWRDPDRWRALRDGSACPMCRDGRPGNVLVESRHSWVAAWERMACRGAACVIAKRHVIEPFELETDEWVGFFGDVLAVARAINELFEPVKLNYEIHGNTIPHLHANLFPRYEGDPFEGGPIRGGQPLARHTPDDLRRMADAFSSVLRGATPDR